MVMFWLVVGILFSGGLSPETEAAGYPLTQTGRYLYDRALQHERDGYFDRAIDRLELLIRFEPDFLPARDKLTQLRGFDQSKKARVMERAVTRSQRALRESETYTRQQAAPRPAPKRSASEASHYTRLPDRRRNGSQWFYIFGPEGSPRSGASTDQLNFYIEVPKSWSGPVFFRVLDADTRGRHDQKKGAWDTVTQFSVWSGRTLLASENVDPFVPNQTQAVFGPFEVYEGQHEGQWRLFRLQVRTLQGDDNNLFALEVAPGSAGVYTYETAVRLPKKAMTWMEFFPEVPASTRELVESNFDFDEPAGRLRLVSPVDPNRGRSWNFRLKTSYSGEWAVNSVALSEHLTGARWTYRLLDSKQKKGNVTFRFTNEFGQPLRTYLN